MAEADIYLRKAEASDADVLARLHRQSRRDAMPWLPVLHTEAEDLWFFKTRVLATEEVWIAHRGTRPAGFVAVREGWVNHLYVAPEFWRCGVGRVMLTRAKASADRLQLWTFQRNERARLFYAAQGFAECELTDGRRNEEQVPDVRMVWVAGG